MELNDKDKKKRCEKGKRRNKEGICVEYTKKAPSLKKEKKSITKKKVSFLQPPPIVESMKPPPPMVKPSVKIANPMVRKVVNEIKSTIQENLTECNDSNRYTNECNNMLAENERIDENEERMRSQENVIYPTLNDPNFIEKIHNKEEFQKYKINGKIYKNIEERANELANSEFGLEPHQNFVKNFMSLNTPYNALLLLHSLGTGKTCSAIGICEDMRDYSKKVGINKKIIIVASDNVQDNFRNQLFDESRLQQVDGMWTINSCVGNKLIKEIIPNPANNKNFSKEKLVSQIKSLIKTYYAFYGYETFSNIIYKIILKENRVKENEIDQYDLQITPGVIKQLRNRFDGVTLCIDEIHNIRSSTSTAITQNKQKKKRNAYYLELLVRYTNGIRLLLLSATPMYNSYKEVVWLLNIMNINDKRSTITANDVFDAEGNVTENGRLILERKSRGYISYVAGENPYLFPYRIYPQQFDKNSSRLSLSVFPKYQINYQPFREPEGYQPIIDVYIDKLPNCAKDKSNVCGNCQACFYKYINHFLVKRGILSNDEMELDQSEAFGYTYLLPLMQSLIITYPIRLKNDKPETYQELIQLLNQTDKFNPKNNDIVVEVKEKEEDEEEEEEEEKENDNVSEEEKDSGESLDHLAQEDLPTPSVFIGKDGLDRVVKYEVTENPYFKGNYEYQPSFDGFFQPSTISKYSVKIKSVLDHIKNTTTHRVQDGVILIYSQYLDSGIIPMALALEEFGFKRYGSQPSLFKNPKPPKNVKTMMPVNDNSSYQPACYAMITGDARFSPNNNLEVKMATGVENKDGGIIKVILITRSGSEGIDLKFIRQVHILDPWYNLNRIEQIIGRAIRNKSHKDLPFEQRNAQIFMHGVVMEDMDMETADMYLYRMSELKAKQIGQVTRILKENSVDCLLNIEQQNFAYDIMDTTIRQKLSDGTEISDFQVGHTPYSMNCDYMENCHYTCNSTDKIDDTNYNTYSEFYMKTNMDNIMISIKKLFRQSYFFQRDLLVYKLVERKQYPLIQIYATLTYMIDSEERVTDRYGHIGKIINVGEYYLFQPIEITDNSISIFERQHSMHNNPEKIVIRMEQPVIEKLEKIKAPVEIVADDELVQQFKTNVNLILAFMTGNGNNVPKSMNMDWYKMSKNMIRQDFNEQSEYIVISHMFDLLPFSERQHLVQYLYSKDVLEDTFEIVLKEYLDCNNVFYKDSTSYLFLCDFKTVYYYKISPSFQLVDSLYTVNEVITPFLMSSPALNHKYDYTTIIGYFEDNGKQRVSFKMKNVQKKNNTGITCNFSKIPDIIGFIQMILVSNKTKWKTEIDFANLSKQELCIYSELLLRYLDKGMYNTNNTHRCFYSIDYMSLKTVLIEKEKQNQKQIKPKRMK